jgi:hypothetical protein
VLRRNSRLRRRTTRIGQALCLLATAAAARPAIGADAGLVSPPLRFHSEVIRLRVRADTLEVEGRYRFLSPPDVSRPLALFYPYPEDSLLGDARTLLLESRCGAEAWQPAIYREVERPTTSRAAGARWRLTTCVGDTLEVRTVYHQSLRGCYARYIVTSTHAWHAPLEHARFEIHLPEDAVPVRFSYPFQRVAAETGCYYLYQAARFLPDQDIIVEWR